jgi:hypothetical protein
MESLADKEGHRAFEIANRNLRPGRDAEGRILQGCHAANGQAVPLDEHGHPIPVADGRWWCDQHRPRRDPTTTCARRSSAAPRFRDHATASLLRLRPRSVCRRRPRLLRGCQGRPLLRRHETGPELLGCSPHPRGTDGADETDAPIPTSRYGYTCVRRGGSYASVRTATLMGTGSGPVSPMYAGRSHLTNYICTSVSAQLGPQVTG